MGRAPCCEKVGLNRGRWTAEEDEILINYIKQNGYGSWRSLPKNAGLLRCGKSCRLRWINYLRDDLKRGNFTRDEEETIIKLHKTLGNKWSLIARHLPGRTDNEVKNYWISHLSRKIYNFRSSCNGSLVTTINMAATSNNNVTKRKGGRVSRAVAKKYNMNVPISSSSLKSFQPNMIADKMVLVDEKGKRDDELTNNVVILHDKVEREGIDDINSSGLLGDWGESFLEMMEQEIEALGPDDWWMEPLADDDPTTFHFEQFLQGDSITDFTEILGHNSRSEGNETTGEKFMMVGDQLENASAVTPNDINNESDNGPGNSSADSNEKDPYKCFSPLNTNHYYDSISWNKEDAAKEFHLWDDEDELLWA